MKSRANVLLFARHDLGRAWADYGVRLITLTDDAEAALTAYAGPGNVLEIANVMERVALLSDGDQVTSSTPIQLEECDQVDAHPEYAEDAVPSEAAEPGRSETEPRKS